MLGPFGTHHFGISYRAACGLACSTRKPQWVAVVPKMRGTLGGETYSSCLRVLTIGVDFTRVDSTTQLQCLWQYTQKLTWLIQLPAARWALSNDTNITLIMPNFKHQQYLDKVVINRDASIASKGLTTVTFIRNISKVQCQEQIKAALLHYTPLIDARYL